MSEASTSEQVEGLHESPPLNTPEAAESLPKQTTDIKEEPQKPQICQFFKRRKWCKFGSRCRFLHLKPNREDEDASASGRGHSKVSEEGGADKGSHGSGADAESVKDSCGSGRPATTAEDVHGGEKRNDMPLKADELKPGVYIPPFQRERESSDGDPSTESGAPSQSDDKRSGKSRVCQFYSRTGRCRFGTRCRLLHERSNIAESVKQSSQDEDRSSEATESENPEPARSSKEQGQKAKMCHFFAKTGRCRFGDKCHFIHGGSDLVTLAVASSKKNNKSEDTSMSSSGKQTSKDNKAGDQPDQSDQKPPARKVCKFFLSENGCSSGNSCRFSHSKHSNANAKSRQRCRYYFSSSGCSAGDACKFSHAERTQKFIPNRPVVAPVKPPTEISLDTVNEEELKRLRTVEITQLNKRYPSCKMTSGDEGETYTVNFHPTDPDWPYDIKELMLDVIFSEDYPKQMMKVNVSDEQELPEVVHRLVGLALSDWVTERYQRLLMKQKVELVFRPFLRWLDKQLEDVFTDALTMYKQELMAKAAGIEFVPVKELQKRYRQDSATSEGDRADAQASSGDDEEEEEAAEANDTSEEDSDEEVRRDKESSGGLDPAKRGTEVKLYGLQLKEGVATVNLMHMALCIQCSRCKNQTDLKVAPNSPTGIGCSKCDQQQIVTFRPAIVHQFSSIVGYLDLHQCTAFDVLLHDCIFQIGCFNCSKEMKLEGMMPGQLKNTWCGSCHAKMSLAIETVRFLHLQPQDNLDLKGVQMLASTRAKKLPKDPAIRDGLPLPAFGTCKHYKKSYRWLRFPCCGKAYPCDLCHEEGEGGDHEMKYANRMICGHCAKEQYYAADRECSRCGSNLTRKGTAHWEGGKGCRDKISMSKNDQQKYSNLNKTISKKASAKLPGAKKNTKLRHS